MENNNTIKEKWNFFDVTALIIGTLVLFMQPLKYVNKIFTYIDETLIMLMLVTYIGDLLKRKKIKKRKREGSRQETAVLPSISWRSFSCCWASTPAFPATCHWHRPLKAMAWP